MTRKYAAQWLGKEVADRLYASKPENGWQQLSDLGLNTGAEGKQAIYDKMLPQKMGKLTGKWGGKVERGTVTSDLGHKVKEIEARVAAFKRTHGLDTDEPLALQLTRLPPAARAEAFDLDNEHERS